MAEEKIKILMAEDEEALRELYKLRFDCENFEVVYAKDGEEALEKALTLKPDIILLDIMMPKKSGMEVLEELKKNPQTSNIPVIMLSVLLNEKVRQDALSLGASYLIKGQVQPHGVVEMIKEKLGQVK